MAHFAFLDTLILLGALQGFIVSVLLVAQRKPNLSNRLLAAIILLAAMACLNTYLFSQNWVSHSSIMALIDAVLPLIMVMPIGPLIYFYTCALLNPTFTISRRQRRHFYVVVIDLAQHLVAIAAILGAITHIHPIPSQLGTWLDNYNLYADIPRWLCISLYTGLAIRLLVKHNTTSANQITTSRAKWLKQFLGAFVIFQCIWLLYLVPYVIPQLSNRLLNAVNWYPVYLPLTALIYWLGIKGYLVLQQQANYKTPASANTLSAETIASISEQLQRAMEIDQLYFNPELSLADVAEHIGISQKNISAVLNQHLHKSFNEFVNEYRIAAFKQRIINVDNSHLTMAGVAAECGFNSQATFQRTFRQFTGLSPSAYRKQSQTLQS